MAKEKWIQDAIKKRGALRRKAKQEHLIKGEEKLSMADLKKLEKEGGKTAKRARLAETLRKFEKGGQSESQNDKDWKEFTPFVVKRLSGAEQIAKSSKEKGGASLLTYEHYNAKLPIYKSARKKFNVKNAKEFFNQLKNKLSYDMEQTEFQKVMGEMEVLGELIIKRESELKMAYGGLTVGRWYPDKTGEEFKYIGADNSGRTLFNDGQKVVYKPLEDFEDSPKEKKLFGFFKEGGQTQ